MDINTANILLDIVKHNYMTLDCTEGERELKWLSLYSTTTASKPSLLQVIVHVEARPKFTYFNTGPFNTVCINRSPEYSL